MKFLFALLLIPLLVIPAYGESQTLPTEEGTLDVKITHEPIESNELSKIKIDNPEVYFKETVMPDFNKEMTSSIKSSSFCSPILAT